MLKVDYTPIQKFSYNQISNHGFQFLLLDENLRGLHSPFQCKDYLQDMFWVENNGKSEDVYGLVWKPGMMNINQDFFRMVLMGGSVELSPIISNMVAFINVFEQAQGFSPTTFDITDDPHNVVVIFSREWVQNGPLLSAYTTLIRLSGIYEPGKDVMEYLKGLVDYARKNPEYQLQIEGNLFPKFMNKEVTRLTGNGGAGGDDTGHIGKLAALLQGKKVECTWQEKSTAYDAHHNGILGFDRFPKVKVNI